MPLTKLVPLIVLRAAICVLVNAAVEGSDKLAITVPVKFIDVMDGIWMGNKPPIWGAVRLLNIKLPAAAGVK